MKMRTMGNVKVKDPQPPLQIPNYNVADHNTSETKFPYTSFIYIKILPLILYLCI
jgi:hypothetical protein